MRSFGNWGKKVKWRVARWYIMGLSGSLERYGSANRKENERLS